MPVWSVSTRFVKAQWREIMSTTITGTWIVGVRSTINRPVMGLWMVTLQ